MFTHALFALAVASSSVTGSAAAGRLHVSHADTVVAARRHTTFGIAIAPVPDSFRRLDYLVPGEGTLIAQVQPGSAADAAQLKAGDLVLAINGKRVDETTIFAAVRDVPRGERFKVELLRNLRWMEVSVLIDR